MFCGHCGKTVKDSSKFCPSCGKSTATSLPTSLPASPPPAPQEKRTHRLSDAEIDVGRPPVQATQQVAQGQYAPPAAGTPAPPPRQQANPPSPPPTIAPKKKFPALLLVVVGAVGGLVALCLLFFFIDPFNLNILGRMTGGYDAAAAAMPADTTAYTSINLLGLGKDRDRLEKLQEAFEDASSGSYNDFDDVSDEFNDIFSDIEDDWDIKFPDDVESWMGQYAGVGLVDASFDRYGGLDDAGWLVAIEVRDKDEADAFLEKVIEGIADSENVRFDDRDYDGVIIYEKDTDYDYDKLAFARAGNMLFISNDRKTIKDGIDAQDGDSLADDKAYREAVKKLPDDRLITMYVSPQLADEAITAVDDISKVETDMLSGAAYALSLTDEGFQIDAVIAYNKDELSEAQEALLQSDYKVEMDGMLPADTLAYVSGHHMNMVYLVWNEFMEGAFGRGDYEEALDLFEDEFNIKPEEFFALLDGEWNMALLPSSRNFWADETGIDLGGVWIADISNAEEMLNISDDFNDVMEDEGLDVDENTQGDATTYEVEENGDQILFYSVDDDYLIIATSEDEWETVTGDGDKLVKNDMYKSVIGALPRGMQPTMYVNITGILETIEDGLDSYDRDSFRDDTGWMEPITAVVAASQSDTNQTHQTIIVFIDTK